MRTLATLCLFVALVAPSFAQDRAQVSVVPRPAFMTPLEGAFVIDSTTTVRVRSDDPEAGRIAEAWAARLRLASGLPLPLVDAPSQLVFALDAEAAIESEGYELTVTSGSVVVRAADAAGLFYGAQTLRQLAPPAIERVGVAPNSAEVEWSVPAVAIEDAPRFAYRGLHLDVARHFFDVETVERLIDQMALYKLNRFHWHLTDDQGWRIEIERYPRLTEVGAFRDQTLVGHAGARPEVYDGVRTGGYYTQDEIREVVAYAAERHVTIVPEIEMPGHASAAIAAYPELGCSGEPVEVAQTWGVFEDIFCPTEETFAFLDDVLTEVVALFPGQVIHIGGDEAPKAAWERSDVAQAVMARERLADEHELQSYFVGRIEAILAEKGRTLMGWDEIVEGGLSPTAVLMFWRHWAPQALDYAAAQGNAIVMTPNHTMYFDHYQGDPALEPLAFGGMSPLEKVYGYEPVPESFTPAQAARVLGTQANVWTEYIPTPSHLEYMVFPRLLALSEVTWSTRDRRDWADFQSRLPLQLRRLDVLGVHYRPPRTP